MKPDFEFTMTNEELLSSCSKIICHIEYGPLFVLNVERRLKGRVEVYALDADGKKKQLSSENHVFFRYVK